MNQKLFAAAWLIFACQQTQVYTVAFCVCLEPKKKRVGTLEKLLTDLWASLLTLISRICYVIDPLINSMNNSQLGQHLSKSR